MLSMLLRKSKEGWVVLNVHQSLSIFPGPPPYARLLLLGSSGSQSRVCLRFLESIFQYLDISHLRHCWLSQLTQRELHEQEGLDAASASGRQGSQWHNDWH